MVEPHGTAATERPAEEPVHPSVHYERGDIEVRGIVIFLGGLVVAGVVIHLALMGLFKLFEAQERPLKETTLPPAYTDRDRLPPEPRLEGVDDLLGDRFQMWPRRAARILGPEERKLEEGDPKHKMIPIEKAIGEVAGSLPVRRTPKSKEEAPATFLRRLPSKAASGRVLTGGQ